MAKPVLIARAKVNGKDPPRWTNIGVAFAAQFENGRGLSVKLDAVPFNWNGELLLVPPRDDDAMPEEPPPADPPF